MQTLIEQNQQQAKQILIQNPDLTKALFQAQIMLGMVKPPQTVPSVQPAGTQNLQPSPAPTPQSHVHSAPLSQGQAGVQDQTRKKQQIQPVIPELSASIPQTLPLNSLSSSHQPNVHMISHPAPVSLPQVSQVSNVPSVPHHSSSVPSHLQSPMLPSSQLQQSMQSSGIPHLQPPLPSQPRSQNQGFPHQHHPQQNMGFQHPGGPQFHHSQPIFRPGTRPPVNAGPPYMQGQPPLPNQMPPQYQVLTYLNFSQSYRHFLLINPLFIWVVVVVLAVVMEFVIMMGNAHTRTDFNQAGSSVQADKASAWIPGMADNRPGLQLPGPPPPVQMGAGNQPQQAPPLTPEMEKALLEKVLCLTPEQINMLPPDQRNQVFQLQQMMRQ
ncbi:hypothetical protein LIER_42225 [Lithospermum erythrorhizon]|uniref:Uncharacterized protein n=1 Tax=Lithospermum erythrorhizon TaxID=34254 RepID=A0AAV3RL69_LITER